MMKCIAKDRIIPFKQRPVFPGFITYISNNEPILLHRYGYVDASDTYDNFGDQISHDNGKTWSERVMRHSSELMEGRRLRITENAMLLDPDTGKLLGFTAKRIYREKETYATSCGHRVEVTQYDPKTDSWTLLEDTTLGLPNLMLSFCLPIKTRSGRLLVPAQFTPFTPEGKPVIHPISNKYDKHALVMIGQYGQDGNLTWKASQTVPGNPAKTSRGLYEPMIAQLRNGLIAMICRGSNVSMEHVIGCKWLSFSNDEGQTWTAAEPLTYTNGDIVESGSSGGALFRSDHNGKLYWIGNPAIDMPPIGNRPRNLLAIFEVCENPFALKTMTIIDRGNIDKTPFLQYSNFRFYQDRLNGDIVLYLSDFGIRGENWKDADYWRYRIQL